VYLDWRMEGMGGCTGVEDGRHLVEEVGESNGGNNSNYGKAQHGG